MKLDQLDIEQLNKLKEDLSNFFSKRYNDNDSFDCTGIEFILFNRYHNELMLRRNFFKLGTKKRFGDLETLWVGDAILNRTSLTNDGET